MTERESWQKAAERVDKQIREGKEAENIVPVSAEVTRSADAVFSIRMTYEDMELLRRYTKAKGIKMSEFARNAMMKAMSEDDEDPLSGLVAGAQQLAKLARRVEASRQPRRGVA